MPLAVSGFRSLEFGGSWVEEIWCHPAFKFLRDYVHSRHENDAENMACIAQNAKPRTRAERTQAPDTAPLQPCPL